ncbi:hypothetical protein FHW03_003480 [Ochrobactrum sp. RH2CCR150]|nr:hypothetical protein [Ochrobactrum sp. RH2CCR150]
MRRNTIPFLLLCLPDRENLPLEAFPVIAFCSQMENI